MFRVFYILFLAYFGEKKSNNFLMGGISMCYQMVTSEIRDNPHARFVQILIISQALRRGKLLGLYLT